MSDYIYNRVAKRWINRFTGQAIDNFQYQFRQAQARSAIQDAFGPELGENIEMADLGVEGEILEEAIGELPSIEAVNLTPEVMEVVTDTGWEIGEEGVGLLAEEVGEELGELVTVTLAEAVGWTAGAVGAAVSIGIPIIGFIVGIGMLIAEFTKSFDHTPDKNKWCYVKIEYPHGVTWYWPGYVYDAGENFWQVAFKDNLGINYTMKIISYIESHPNLILLDRVSKEKFLPIMEWDKIRTTVPFYPEFQIGDYVDIRNYYNEIITPGIVRSDVFQKGPNIGTYKIEIYIPPEQRRINIKYDDREYTYAVVNRLTLSETLGPRRRKPILWEATGVIVRDGNNYYSGNSYNIDDVRPTVSYTAEGGTMLVKRFNKEDIAIITYTEDPSNLVRPNNEDLFNQMKGEEDPDLTLMAPAEPAKQPSIWGTGIDLTPPKKYLIAFDEGEYKFFEDVKPVQDEGSQIVDEDGNYWDPKGAIQVYDDYEAFKKTKDQILTPIPYDDLQIIQPAYFEPDMLKPKYEDYINAAEEYFYFIKSTEEADETWKFMWIDYKQTTINAYTIYMKTELFTLYIDFKNKQVTLEIIPPTQGLSRRRLTPEEEEEFDIFYATVGLFGIVGLDYALGWKIATGMLLYGGIAVGELYSFGALSIIPIILTIAGVGEGWWFYRGAGRPPLIGNYLLSRGSNMAGVINYFTNNMNVRQVQVYGGPVLFGLLAVGGIYKWYNYNGTTMQMGADILGGVKDAALYIPIKLSKLGGYLLTQVGKAMIKSMGSLFDGIAPLVIGGLVLYLMKDVFIGVATKSIKKNKKK